jgi:hypothetical protein
VSALRGWEKLNETIEDPVDCPDRVRQTERKPQGTWRSPVDGAGQGETWRRVLTAHIQPLPAAAD